MKCRETHQEDEIPKYLQICGTPIAATSAHVVCWRLYTVRKWLYATACVLCSLGTPHELWEPLLCVISCKFSWTEEHQAAGTPLFREGLLMEGGACAS